jgi:hypothetical protein
MNSLLSKILKSRNITKIDELSREERATFDNWESVLAKRELTLEDLKQFIAARIDNIEMKWRDMNLDASKKAELVPYHTVYKMISQAISAPEAERAALEKVLVQMIQK